MGPNKYESFVHDLIEKTTKEEISWKFCKPSQIPFLIPNLSLVKKAYTTKNFDGTGKDIFIVDTLNPRHDQSGGEEFDVSLFSIHLIKDNVEAKKIDKYEVDEDTLSKLVETVDSLNNVDREFFKKYEQ